MSQTVETIYKRGAFHPLRPLKGLPENARVRITVEAEPAAAHPLERFAGSLTAEEADEMLRLVEEEFEQVDPDAR